MCCLYDYMITDVSCTLSGAMENWGLITGRTNAFLLDPKNRQRNKLHPLKATKLLTCGKNPIFLPPDMQGMRKLEGLEISRRWSGGTISTSMKALPL